MRRGALLAAAAASLVAAAPASAYPNPGSVVGDTAVHDPSMVIRENDEPKRWALYSTHDRIHYSPLLRFAFVGAGVSHPNRPLWWTDWASTPWAPDVSFHNGRYWMYYALSTYGSQRSAIALSTSPSGDPGSWTDHGIVFTSSPGDPYNAIDPNLVVDGAGRWWLTFGSFWGGIYQVELNPSTGMLKSGAPFANVAARPAAGDQIEAPFVYRHGGQYYLFVSWGLCCKGANSTYEVRVGRSSSPNGPFLDRGGVDMRSGGGTLVLEGHGDIRGPGGQSVAYDSWDDKDLLVYHYYDARLAGQSFLGINYLGWDSGGWPYVW